MNLVLKLPAIFIKLLSWWLYFSNIIIRAFVAARVLLIRKTNECDPMTIVF